MLSTLSNRWGTLLSDPFEAVRREFDRDFGFVGNGNSIQAGTTQYGHLALWEDNEHVFIEMDVPGMQIDDLDLAMEKGRLWIRGERKLSVPTSSVSRPSATRVREAENASGTERFPQHDQQRWYDERYYGKFQRIISLNDTVDSGSIDATLSDGVLYVTLTKKPEHQPHRVEVKYAAEPKRISDEKSDG